MNSLSKNANYKKQDNLSILTLPDSIEWKLNDLI